MSGPGAEPPAVPADEAAVRAELEDVRSSVVELWQEGDAPTGREVLPTVVGGLAAGIALLLIGIVLTSLGEEPPAALAAVSVLAVLLLAVAGRGFRSPVRRRVQLHREVRRLRARERELIALLPAGTAGRGAYPRYYVARFSNPVMVLIYLGLFVVLLLTLLT